VAVPFFYFMVQFQFLKLLYIIYLWLYMTRQRKLVPNDATFDGR